MLSKNYANKKRREEAEEGWGNNEIGRGGERKNLRVNPDHTLMTVKSLIANMCVTLELIGGGSVEEWSERYRVMGEDMGA
jgi:hypothetical protein